MTDVHHEAPLPTGTPAPEFELPCGPDATLGLRDLRGRPAVLAFYPADWSPVCSDQMVLYQEIRPMLDEFDAQIVGISVDGTWCHRAWAQQRGIAYPLLSDFEPKGAVSRAFGAYRGAEGVSERALFVLDRDGAVHWSYRSPIEVNPGADGILHALNDLTGREARV
jgi:peroxiredoxin